MEPCVFCELIAKGLPEVAAGSGVHILEPLNPVTEGHVLFLPREHVAFPDQQPAIAGLVMNMAAKFVSLGATNWPSHNYIFNSGVPASQTIFHMHLHLIPRRPGDGLILPWTNQGKDLEAELYKAMEDSPTDHLVTVDAAKELAQHMTAELKKQGVI